MESNINYLIQEVLSRNRFFRAYDQANHVYHPDAVIEINSIFGAQRSIIYDVNVGLIPTEDLTEPDRWCNVSWLEGKRIRSVGFNFISYQRLQAYELHLSQLQV